MPRPKSVLPSYRLHKPSGQAVSYVNRKPVYLGQFGTAESRERYAKLLTEVQNSQAQSAPESRPSQTTVAAVALRFATEELPRYANAEQHCLRTALRFCVDLFGETSAAEFGPLRLRTARKAMVESGWSRGFTNRQVKRVKRVFRWAVSLELVPASVVQALATLDPIAAGETEAPESRERRAIPEADLKAVRNVLDGVYRDLFDLMLLTGSRPGELVSLTVGDVDQTGDVWRAGLRSHKTRHMGKSRTLFFNRTAQEILSRYLTGKPTAPVFAVRRVVFGRVVSRACEVAFNMPEELRKPDTKKLTPKELADVRQQAAAWRREHCWTPHWLRHTVATRLADDVGTEAAQRLLGHATKAMTEHYSRAAEKQAVAAAKSLE